MIQIPMMLVRLASLTIAQKAARLVLIAAVIVTLTFIIEASLATATAAVTGFVGSPSSVVTGGLALMPTNTMACLELTAATYLSRWLFDSKLYVINYLVKS